MRCARASDAALPLHDGCALFLDIDGTLLELAPTPDAVRVDGCARRAAAGAARRLGGAVALITGRAHRATSTGCFPACACPIAGQHGGERRDAAGHAAPARARRRPTLARLRALFAAFAARPRGPAARGQGRDARAALPPGAAARLARAPHAARDRRRERHARLPRCSPASACSKCGRTAATRARRSTTSWPSRRSRALPGLRRRRPRRRARLRGRRAPRRLDGQGRPGCDDARAIASPTWAPSSPGSPPAILPPPARRAS